MKKIIFFNTGWMREYKGIKEDDVIQGGGEHIQSEGWGGEIFNFLEHEGKLYGYVEAGGNVHIERIGAKKTDAKIDDVLVVWTARRPGCGGTFVIGWYKNATVYRERRKTPVSSNRIYRNHHIDYVAVADVNNCTLLEMDERIIKVPRGKGGMGHKNIWYAEENPQFINLVVNYVLNNVAPVNVEKEKSKGTARQPNVEKRAEVEKAAVKVVAEHYERKNYVVESVENENTGWDLVAKYNDTILLLEVKGMSGTEIATELTPNEYKKMNLEKYKYSYRLCIVTSALSTPRLSIFSYSTESGYWENEKGQRMNFEEVIKARISLS
ncbi:MAG TPA: DUF3883 domain-containing protein [Chitinophagales bacterium]|nr:DUF3883 domain-containing protein [Chitinophagales bacterium]